MNESDPETISIRVSSAHEQPASVSPKSDVLSKFRVPRPSVIAAASILAENGEVAAELDGIEAVTPLFDPPEPPLAASEGIVERSSKVVVPDKAHGKPARAAVVLSTASDFQRINKEVWLTGTIEVDESDDKIQIPQRISGGPTESTNLR